MNQAVQHYFDVENPKAIKRSAWLVFVLLLLASGLPSLWAPFDGDQALFFVSGQKILAGDILYRDILDLKPPLIYFIYAGAVGIFGESIVSVRLVELLTHFVVVWLLIRTVRRVSNNDAWAMLAGLSYAALYFSLPFYSRGQVEGFANLPIVCILSSLVLWSRSQHYRHLLMIGLMIGVLLLLKTSFLVLLPTIGLLFLFDPKLKFQRWLQQVVFVGVGCIPPLVGMFLYLWLTNSLADFMLMQEFTRGYAAVQWGSFLAPITEAIRQIPWYFATTYSALLAVLTVVGIFLFLFTPNKKDSEAGWSATTIMLQFAVLLFVVLLATVGVEAKYLTWHFNRLFVPGALLASWGAVQVLHRITTARLNRFSFVMGLACVVPLLMLSPLVRYGWNNRAFLINRADGIEAFNSALGMDGDGFDLHELKEVGEYLRDHKKPGGKIFVASGWGGAIHFFAEDVPDFKSYQSGFLIAPYAPEQWREETRKYLLSTKPQFIVAQHDAMPHITGEETTSLEMVIGLAGIDSLLRTDYTLVLETKMTEVYERK